MIVLSLGAGGLEKSALKLAQGLKLEGYSVDIFKYDSKSIDFFSSENPTVPIRGVFSTISLLRSKSRIKFVRFSHLVSGLLIEIRRFRQIIKREGIDLVISFGAGTGVLTHLLLLGMRVPQIVSERTHPDPKIYRPSFPAQLLRPYIYKRGVTCVVQTRGVKEWVKNNWGISSIAIPNHTETPNLKWEYTGQHTVLWIGRDSEEKRLDLLLCAWRQIQHFHALNLLIVSNSRNLQEKIQMFDCERVDAIDFQSELQELMLASRCLVSTSRVEGYPNVIAEAISLGLPVLATISTDQIVDWCDIGYCHSLGHGECTEVSQVLVEAFTDTSYHLKSTSRRISGVNLPTWNSVFPLWERVINGIPYLRIDE